MTRADILIYNMIEIKNLSKNVEHYFAELVLCVACTLLRNPVSSKAEFRGNLIMPHKA